jgi:predicted nucleotidyltransferase
MTSIFRDISGKIEPGVLEALQEIDAVAQSLGLPFMLVGAKARDLFFAESFGIQSGRATRDVDLAIQVSSWNEYDALVNRLLAGKNFVRDRVIKHRLQYKDYPQVDIIPFGEIEDPPGSVSWSDDGLTSMCTVGFKDASESCVTIRLKSGPDLDIRVPVPAGMAIMKLVSWHEKYPERQNDATDLIFLMKEYVNAGNETRLFEEDADVVAMDGFDFEMASPRLLGRDIARIASVRTLAAVEHIIDAETNPDSSYRLVQDIMGGKLYIEESFDWTLDMLKQLKEGIQDVGG